MQAFLNEASLRKYLLVAPLQAAQIRAIEGRSKDNKQNGKGFTAKEGVDKDKAGICVVICILEGSS